MLYECRSLLSVLGQVDHWLYGVFVSLVLKVRVPPIFVKQVVDTIFFGSSRHACCSILFEKMLVVGYRVWDKKWCGLLG